MAPHLPTSIRTMPHREGSRHPSTTVSHTDRWLQTLITTNNHLQIPGPWTFFRNPDYKPLEMITDHGVPPSVQSVESIKSLVVIQIFSKLESVKHSGLLLDFCIISPSFYNRLCLLLPCANGSSSQALRPWCVPGPSQWKEVFVTTQKRFC